MSSVPPSLESLIDWCGVFAGFPFFVHAGIITFNLGYEFPFTNLLLGGVALLFYYAGIVLTKAKRNWFIGTRTP